MNQVNEPPTVTMRGSTATARRAWRPLEGRLGGVHRLRHARVDRPIEKRAGIGHLGSITVNPTGSLEDNALIDQAFAEAANVSLRPLSDQEFDSGTLVHIVMDSLDDAKAEDSLLIDLHGKTSIADAMIITTGRSNVHVASIADRVLKALKGSMKGVPRIEGLAGGDWVLIDAGDIIVHVFRPEVRQFYNLEKMWGSDRPLTA